MSALGICARCAKGRCDNCYGFIGTMRDHPDIAPLCECTHATKEETK